MVSTSIILPTLTTFMDDEMADYCDGLTLEEIEYYVYNDYNIATDGYAFSSAVESFHSAADAVGEVTSIGSANAVISGSEIIVEVEIKGTGRDAKAELILSNDLFLRLESAALNPVESTGELMGKAALNTVIGMGTVFIVLILISLIISCFGLITKAQNASAKKKAAREKEQAQVQTAAVQAAPVETADETDDLELVAVISAAIAACEGAVSTDGFVVRSVIRRR